ncbi:MAG: class I SAM-dependent methyltransferase [Mollicutes bacterium]|nr:class I SAM-dependent methyltransferase [Mollicutes bacterium]
MDKQLDLVAKSYNKTIELGKKVINLYENLPEYITNDPDYLIYKKELENDNIGSENIKIKEFLEPTSNMNFIDLGCCLNFMFKGYDKWPSKYHGVDISSKNIELLNEFILKKGLLIDKLYCGSIHETPFADNYFDIGACIGVLEYFEKDYVEKSLKEMHRILKPNGKLVLDIPNIESKSGKIMMKIEEYMRRPDKFNMNYQEFEKILKKYFEIVKTNSSDSNSMGFSYYLRCKKIL